MIRLLLIICTCPLLLVAQVDPIAEAIKPNVVAITADFFSGAKEQGFGFVVGEHKGVLYLATAGHVIREDGAMPGKENATNIQLVFCGDDRTHTARILKATISPFDFGLLEMDKPSGYVWKADCLGTKPGAGTSVSYIGRNNTCYIPSSAVRGMVNRSSLDRISLDINGISRGTSGAPLLGANGLVGMIVNAESASAEALTLDRLREEITNEGYYPFRFNLVVEELNTIPSSDLSTYNMVTIDGGTFEMGCKPERDGTCRSGQTPLHQVSISSFYLSKYEVTYRQFKAFVDATKYITDAEKKGYCFIWTSSGSGLGVKGVNWRHDVKGQLRSIADYQHPVIHVSQNDAKAYCEWLSKQTGKTYRLPTEAEWEYAARGGKLSKGYRYAGSNELKEIAWYFSNSGNTTHAVGGLRANELGLFDLSGNVREWCSDRYDGEYYKNSPPSNPQGPTSGSSAVLRGGSCYYQDGSGRLADRGSYIPDGCYFDSGFRLARNL